MKESLFYAGQKAFFRIVPLILIYRLLSSLLRNDKGCEIVFKESLHVRIYHLMECNISICTVMLSSNVKCFYSLERSQRYPCGPLQAVYVSPMLCMLQSISYTLWIPGEILESDPPFVKCLPCLPMFGCIFSILMKSWRFTLRRP